MLRGFIGDLVSIPKNLFKLLLALAISLTLHLSLVMFFGGIVLPAVARFIGVDAGATLLEYFIQICVVKLVDFKIILAVTLFWMFVEPNEVEGLKKMMKVIMEKFQPS